MAIERLSAPYGIKVDEEFQSRMEKTRMEPLTAGRYSIEIPKFKAELSLEVFEDGTGVLDAVSIPDQFELSQAEDEDEEENYKQMEFPKVIGSLEDGFVMIGPCPDGVETCLYEFIAYSPGESPSKLIADIEKLARERFAA